MQREFDRIIAQLRNQEISRVQAEHLLQELKARQRSTLPTPPNGVGTDNLSAAKPPQIAIIGMSGQFPGAADIGAFWQNLVSGHDGIGELPPHDWPEQLRQDAQSHYRWGGVVAERACFDPLFFNISPREAEAMHPHQRLILQESWKALEDAGYNPKSLAETQVGLYIGAEPIGYFHDSFTGSSEAIIASRLSYHLNLKGPALVVNTGCSSSGVAIHLACESLRHGETCMALAGGVFAMLAQDMLDALADIGMLSASHRCKSFDAAADGTAFSEGVGVVVLKRLEDAQADGDPIYALIVGSGINQDGTSNGITAPNGTAQEALITDVYRRYRINPEQITYVEAHGTGTKLGDPVEANALARAFRQFTDKQGYCRVGSAKAHIGHTSASAGVIGLIKVLLSLQHHKIPGLLHFEQLNPLIDWQASAFYLTTQTLPWQASDGAPLLAALNSFGHSGTNVHLVVSEYQTPEPPSLPDLSQPVLIPLSANTLDSLQAYSAKLARFLVEGTVRLADLAYTLPIARDAMPERVVFLVQTSAELVAGLQAFSSGQTLGLPYWQGQVADTSALSEDDKAVLADLSIPARLAKMAALWVQGVVVDWHKLYGADRLKRIHIPTYAFAKEHYWAQAKTPTLSIAPYNHPLVQENTSDFAGQRYSSILTGQEFFLAGHQLHGKPVLPGVAYLEMAVAAVKRATARYGHTDGLIRLKNVVWVRPLEVSGAAVTVHIGLVPEDDGQVQFEIYTQADADATNVHSQGMAEALAPPAPRYLDLPQLQAHIQRAYPHPEQCYQYFRTAGVVHSADFQCLQAIYTAKRQVLAKLALPVAMQQPQDPFTLHPCLLDAVLQATFGLYDDSADTLTLEPSLPFALASLTVFAPCPDMVWCWIRHADTSTASVQKLDIDVVDGQGLVVMELRGFSSRVLAADGSSQESDGQGLLAPVWTAYTKPEWLTCPLPDTLLIIGGTAGQQQAVRQHYPSAQNLDLPADADCAAITRLLVSVGEVAHILWLAPDEIGERAADRVAGQQQGVIQLFRLIKALLALNYAPKALVWTFVTTLTQPIPSVMGGVESAPLQPTHASVHGLVGSLAKEYPHWHIRLFDLPAFPHWPLKEVFSMAPADAVGNAWVQRGAEWFRQELWSVRPSATPLETTPYRHRGVYVVIGGAGGIAGVWSRHVISHYQARIVWLGRRVKNADIQAQLDTLASLGEAPDYITADAANPHALVEAYQQIRLKYGAIQGVVHSAIVLKDQGLTGMDEATFSAGLRAKVDTSVHIADIFGKEPLDFMLFFSSVVAFGKVAGQSNYAAGSTFMDAFAYKLAQDSAYAVKIMNWGYWGTVGIVATPDYQARMKKAGLASITPEEGMAALQDLMLSSLPQMALLKTVKPGALGGINNQAWLKGLPQRLPALMPALQQALAGQTFPITEEMVLGGQLIGHVETQLYALLYAQMQALGAFAQPDLTVAQLKQTLGCLDVYGSWFAETLAALARSGYLQLHANGQIRVADAATADLPTCWQRWEQAKPDWLAHRMVKPLVLLAEKMLRVLPEILTGKLAATEVMFPNASLVWVEDIYQNNPVADYFNDVVGDTLVAYLKQRLAHQPDSRLRILEIGAGTGGTTAKVLPRLRDYHNAIAEYCYTDVSQVFLQHAQRHYAPEHSFLSTAIVDVEKPLYGQLPDVGAYDVVIATNVLHATKNIRTTLSNVKAALGKQGILILNEMSCNPISGHLTFGLLKGWWLAEDLALRLPGSPALSSEAWLAVLNGEGFEGMFLPVPHAHAFGNQIIVAASNGIVRQARPLSLPDPLERDVDPLVSPEPPIAGPTPAVDDALLREKTTAYLKNLIGTTLKIPLHRIDAGKALEHYGIDSILVIQLSNALGKVFADIHSTLFFEYQTIEALVGHFVATRRAELLAILGLTGQAAQSPELAPNKAPDFRRRPLPVVAETAIHMGNKPFDVAIIGLAGRYPQAQDVGEFWQNLRDGKHCISEIPGDRWDWQRYFHEEKGKPGVMYSKWGGFIGAIDQFDPLFFQISPREAELMDPQERLFLETAWHCLEDAGYMPATISRDNLRKIGVFVGVMNSAYNPQPAYASIANRVSYLLDFHGPSMAVDTACSSSLTAVHLALESLYGGSSECALAGGVNLIVDPVQYLRLSAMTVLSSGDQCKSFGDQADGIVDGEGVGAVLLKPLAQAIADHDTIYGVIKGSMVNAGGKTNGYTVPNPKAQARLIRDALQRAHINARSISYVEAHGTGTILGDPIEIAGLARAFAEDSPDLQFCALGSAKSNIGHCESAAGIAGLTKVLLQLKHQQLVPTLHAEQLNPHIDFAATPFTVNRKLREWRRPVVDGKEYPRRAGISSFGAGGANAHLIVEEYRPTSHYSYHYPVTASVMVVLSARKLERLQDHARQLLAFIVAETPVLADLAYTLQVGRVAMEWRLGLVVSSLAELMQALQDFLNGADLPTSVMLGEAKADNATLTLFTNDDELQDVVAKWLQRGKFKKVLELWVKGLAVDWLMAYGETRPQRISLPVYPFARERYWQPARMEQTARPHHLHPLVQENRSTFQEQCFKSVLTGEEFFLTDHRVQGQKCLPGVAYLEMARAALAQSVVLSPEASATVNIHLHDIVWVQPLLVGQVPVTVAISLQADDDGVVAYSIHSEADTLVLHSQGRAVFAESGGPVVLDLAQLQTAINALSFTPEQCYAAHQNRGISYGPAHQSVTAIYTGNGQVLAQLLLPDTIAATHDTYLLHPSLLDGALQAAIGFWLASGQDACQAPPVLPFALAEVAILKACPTSVWAWIRPSDSQAENPLLKLDIDICDGQGAVCVSMKGFSAREVAAKETFKVAPQSSKTVVEKLEIYAPVWNPLPLMVGQDLLPIPQTRVLGIGGDSTQRQAIATVYPHIHWLDLPPDSDIGVLSSQLTAVGRVGHIVWIAPAVIGDNAAEEALIGQQQKGLIALFRLIKALLALAYGLEELAWTVLTTYTQPVRKKDPLYPTHAGVHGLIGCLAKEYPHWQIRLLDMAKGDDWPVRQLFSLPPNPRGDAWAYRDGEWFGQTLVAVQAPATGASLYRQQGVYVVVGGAGGIGAAWSAAMLEQYQAQIVWIGRRPLDADIQAKLDALAKWGEKPHYIQADASDEPDLQRAYQTIKTHYGQIHGVIHSAIVLQDQGLANMDETRFRAGLSAKITASVRLAQVFRAEPLDFILFFSSAVAFEKVPGQSNYAAGSTFKDAYAHYLAKCWACPVKIINWGYWGSVGIVKDAVYQERMARAGLASIEPAEGMHALDVLLQGSFRQLALIKTLKSSV